MENKGSNDKYSTVTLSIGGMQCQSCERKVAAALMGFAGVADATVDLAGQKAIVRYDSTKVRVKGLKKIIAAQGYTALETDANESERTENCCNQRMKWSSKPGSYLFGAMAALAIVAMYLAMNTLTADWYFAKIQFSEYRWWIITLAIGLGIQVTLFTRFRAQLRNTKMRAAKSSMAASGGVSTAAMMACCSHYLATVLPTLGVSFLSASAVASLEQYQAYFFLAGVLSSLFGIGLLLRLMAKHGMIQTEPLKSAFNIGLQRLNISRRYGNDNAKAF
jgi:cation transport ATPase